MVVNGAGTGGARAHRRATTSSGKTGTAQVISNSRARGGRGKTDKDLRDHGWFVFFAPRDNPQIAGVVFVEHGEHGVERRADRASTCSRRSSPRRKGGRCRRAPALEAEPPVAGRRRRAAGGPPATGEPPATPSNRSS